MPRKKGPSMSRSLFASLPHELRETIRIKGALPSVQAPTSAPSIAPVGHVSFTQLEQQRCEPGQGFDRQANGRGNGNGSGMVQELVRTQPESPDSSDSSDTEEEEQVEDKGAVGVVGGSHMGEEKSDKVVDRPRGDSMAGLAVYHDQAQSGRSNPEATESLPPATGAVPMAQISILASSSALPSTRRRQSASALRSVRREGTWVPAEDHDTLPAVPRKKRKKNNNGYTPSSVVYNPYAGHPYDCTGLVQRYSDYKGVPMDIRKYYAQRHLMFAEYDELPLLLDHTGWFSVTPQPVARHIAERCRCDVIVDAFCGIGGNAIEFAKTCERAIDNDITRLRLARHNALQYGVADRIEFIHGSYIDFARSYAASDAPDKEAIDVVFLSPPWGGVDYLTFTADPLPFPPSPLVKSGSTPTSAPNTTSKASSSDARSFTGATITHDTSAPPKYPLSAIEPIHGAELFQLSLALTPNIAYYLPKNTNLRELADLAPCIPSPEAEQGQGGEEGERRGRRDKEWVEVEEEWVGEKVKAITAYYGSLVSESGMVE